MCNTKFIHVSIQTCLGGKDDIQILLQGSTEYSTERDDTSGAKLAVVQFKTKVNEDTSSGEKGRT